ncbi:hypothetical protein ACOIWI_000524 [Vibrio vulnificus]|nr:hypothetical protein [Vibrio vulnificus]EJP4175471.1 hypothetical protein [Vibrio vulnificus]ELX4197063.1 hypothetical protein [Vibrio vulnificus]
MFKQETFQLDATYIIVVIILVVTLLFVLLMKSRFKINPSKEGDLKLTDQIYLDNKNKVSVVKYKENEYVIVIGPSGVAITENMSKSSG